MAVYFIQAGEGGPVKIGCGVSPRDRLLNLRIAHWMPLSIRRLFLGHRREEEMVHRLMADHHIAREWFAPVVLTLPVPLDEVSMHDPDAMNGEPVLSLAQVQKERARNMRRGILMERPDLAAAFAPQAAE